VSSYLYHAEYLLTGAPAVSRDSKKQEKRNTNGAIAISYGLAPTVSNIVSLIFVVPPTVKPLMLHVVCFMSNTFVTAQAVTLSYYRVSGSIYFCVSGLVSKIFLIYSALLNVTHSFLYTYLIGR
jgi:hypothetical protein